MDLSLNVQMQILSPPSHDYMCDFLMYRWLPAHLACPKQYLSCLCSDCVYALLGMSKTPSTELTRAVT